MAAARYTNARSSIKNQAIKNMQYTKSYQPDFQPKDWSMEIGVMLVMLLIPFAVWALNYGLNKQAVVDCNTLKAQAAEYPNFFLAGWQKTECDSVGIIINAPVK